MKKTTNQRTGKSLVELLMVIGIIALMVSMFLSGAMYLLRFVQNLAK